MCVGNMNTTPPTPLNDEEFKKQVLKRLDLIDAGLFILFVVLWIHLGVIIATAIVFHKIML